MGNTKLKSSMLLVCMFMLSGCKDENGNFSVGVSLGGTGTGDVSLGTQSPVPKPLPDVNPDRMEEDTEYAVAYPNSVTQNCEGVERTIQFVRHYAPYIPMKMGDRMDLLSIHSPLSVKYKLQVIVKNSTSFPIYEYINSCEAAFQLTGTKTAKKTQTDYCLNDETVNIYQPNESRTFYYAFNLPNILQNWTVSYHTQYSKQLYPSPYDDENSNIRTQCAPLSTILLIDEYPSSKSEVPLVIPDTKTNNSSNPQTSNESAGNNQNNANTSENNPPICGGFDLEDDDLGLP